MAYLFSGNSEMPFLLRPGVGRVQHSLHRGELKAGKLADIIAVDGNPLVDIKVMEQVVFVMKDGEVVKAD